MYDHSPWIAEFYQNNFIKTVVFDNEYSDEQGKLIGQIF